MVTRLPSGFRKIQQIPRVPDKMSYHTRRGVPVSAENDPLRAAVQRFEQAVESVVIGQGAMVQRILIALLTDGHVLLEGVPGLAKTLLMRSVASALGLTFSRIQFTPDLLPADVIGTQIYHPRSGDFSVKQGPVFANILLADEINRAPAKVQSALLQAMAERQVTIGESTRELPRPFFVLATQNPLEQEGTYALPEAQLDRFMLKLVMTYPGRQDDLAILNRMGSVETSVALEPVLSLNELQQLRHTVDVLHVDDRVKGYIVDLVRATRPRDTDGPNPLKAWIQHGASPRAAIALLRAAKAHAYLVGRNYVVPDDVKQLSKDVLRHRIILSYEAEAEELTADTILGKLLDQLPVP